MRLIFTDGWNSIWHFIFGCMSVFIWMVHPIFYTYQLKDPFEKNILVDFCEFFIGYCLTISIVFFQVFRYYNQSIDFIIRILHKNSSDN